MTKTDLTLTDCLHVEVGYGGNMTFVIGSSRSESQVRFDLGQRLVITQDEGGLLRVVIERTSDEPV